MSRSTFNNWTTDQPTQDPLTEAKQMSEKAIFKKIIDGEIPANLLHEDEHWDAMVKSTTDIAECIATVASACV